jgi:DDE superfamily endonuclease
MLPQVTLPSSLALLVEVFGSCFTVPTFAMFRLLLTGLIAQAGRRTVCGMLLGAGAAEQVPHDRAHRFFAQASWSIDQLGLTLARLVVQRLVPPGDHLYLAVDDTLFRRRGKLVHHAFWTHDGSQPGHVTARGNRWVVLGLVVTLPMCSRPVCLPILLRLWAGKGSPSPVELARTMIGLVARAFPDHRLHVAADAAYHGRPLRELPARIAVTTRLPRNAVLFLPAPPRTGRRGRPRTKGDASAPRTRPPRTSRGDRPQ